MLFKACSRVTRKCICVRFCEDVKSLGLEFILPPKCLHVKKILNNVANKVDVVKFRGNMAKWTAQKINLAQYETRNKTRRNIHVA